MPGKPFQYYVFNAVFFAVLTFDRLVSVFIHGVYVRPDALDFGFGVEPAIAG